jgi:hypothetical protein
MHFLKAGNPCQMNGLAALEPEKFLAKCYDMSWRRHIAHMTSPSIQTESWLPVKLRVRVPPRDPRKILVIRKAIFKTNWLSGSYSGLTCRILGNSYRFAGIDTLSLLYLLWNQCLGSGTRLALPLGGSLTRAMRKSPRHPTEGDALEFALSGRSQFIHVNELRGLIRKEERKVVPDLRELNLGDREAVEFLAACAERGALVA